jgi:AAA domain
MPSHGAAVSSVPRISPDIVNWDGGTNSGTNHHPAGGGGRDGTPEPANENLVVPDLGIGAGPPVGVFGQGYVGKTILCMSLGMSVALGRPAWGKYRVRRGVWVHFDYEQGRKETKRRVQRIAAAFGVGREETRDLLHVAVYPEVNLTTPDAVQHYVEAMHGASIATIDALKGITPGVEENSSSMRDFMRILSMASEATGCTVLLIHHAGKFDGKKARKELGRGSSAIYDECQAVFVVTGDKDEDKRVTHEKDRELGETVPEFALRIEDVATCDVEYLDIPGAEEIAGDVSLENYDPKGGLRVVAVAGVAEQQADRIVAHLTSVGGVFEGSRTDLVAEIGMNRTEFFRAFAVLEQDNRVEVLGRSKKENRPKGQIALVEDESYKSSHSPESSRSPRDGLGRNVENRPAPPSFKDGRDDGTISEDDEWDEILAEV